MNEPQRPPGMTDEMEAAYALAARDQDSARCREVIYRESGAGVEGSLPKTARRTESVA